MKAKYTAAASSFILALAMAGTAGAAGMSEGTDVPQSSGASSFQDLDKDGDGVVSMQEAQDKSGLVDQWHQIDANGDNQIDQAEFSASEAEQGPGGATGGMGGSTSDPAGSSTSDPAGSSTGGSMGGSTSDPAGSSEPMGSP